MTTNYIAPIQSVSGLWTRENVILLLHRIDAVILLNNFHIKINKIQL